MTEPHTAWMPFYIADYLRDTTHLLAQEHGCYVLLLMHAWTHDGILPLDEVRLRAIGRMDEREWKASRKTLLEFFTRSEQGFRQKRVDIELVNSRGITSQRSAAGKASAALRKAQREGNGEATALPTKVQREGNGVANESSTGGQRGGQRNGRHSPRTEEAKAATSYSDSSPRGVHVPREAQPTNGHASADTLGPIDLNNRADPRLNCVDASGKMQVGGWYWDEVWPRIVEAARIDETRWRGTDLEARRWLIAGIEPDTIVATIEARMSAPKPPSFRSLAYFERAIHEAHGRHRQ